MPGLHFELNAATVEFLFISDSPGHKLVEWALVVAFDEETIDRINRGSIRHDQTTDVLAKALLLLRGVKELVKMIGVSCPATEIPEPGAWDSFHKTGKVLVAKYIRSVSSQAPRGSCLPGLHEQKWIKTPLESSFISPVQSRRVAVLNRQSDQIARELITTDSATTRAPH